MKRVSAFFLLFLAACAARERDRNEPAPEPFRLCVENATAAYGALTARAGLVRFDVLPGERVCKPLIVTGGAIALRAETIGGGAAGPQRYAEQLQPGGSRCWRWRLTDSPASSVDLMPCDLVDEDETDTVPADTAAADTTA
ncbi:hypothetical protein [Longimicrobium sp.]|uniref:hypothetical protein n=1 Tax=Longimicrobium sp. TaxID=2029185 RepID=UPI002E349E12|nr:hypothetical protein [Longimicrobium sp.]HEX6037125.1 hypothetical protein [Longimicrobium sp.]